MRYFVHEVTRDRDHVAEVVGENSAAWFGPSKAEAAARLLAVWRHSTRVWLAVDGQGAPAALFGVAPVEDDPAIGQFWMVVLDAFDDSDDDLRAVTRLVFDEMLRDFAQVENMLDERKTWALGLMRALGFTIEPAVPRLDSPARFHRVWLGTAPSNRPTTLPN
jgi:hypothetical protein